MNSTIKTAAKITEVLIKSDDDSDAKQDGIQHTKARLGDCFKKWKNKVVHGHYIRSIDRQLVGEYTLPWLSRGEQKME
jgi:hypothetical protein